MPTNSRSKGLLSTSCTCILELSFLTYKGFSSLVHGSNQSQRLTNTTPSSAHKLIRFLKMLLSVGVYMDLCGLQRDPAPLRAVREAPLVLWLVLPGRPVDPASKRPFSVYLLWFNIFLRECSMTSLVRGSGLYLVFIAQTSTSGQPKR